MRSCKWTVVAISVRSSDVTTPLSGIRTAATTWSQRVPRRLLRSRYSRKKVEPFSAPTPPLYQPATAEDRVEPGGRVLDGRFHIFLQPMNSRKESAIAIEYS